MSSTPLLIEDNFEQSRFLGRHDVVSHPSINRAYFAVAQEVVELLKQAYPAQMDSNSVETIMIRAVEPEYRQVIEIEPLTAREQEVLQLIVDGYSNYMIARKLHITVGTVKTHVCKVLKKLYASDRTQAAILGLRAGLAH